MKLLRFATITALSTAFLTAGVTAFAEEARQVDTDGEITFTANDEEETEVDPPETWPPVIIPPAPPGQTGPLTLAYAPTFDFGRQVISNQDASYSLIAEMQQVADENGLGTGEMIPYVSFAQVQDTRGNNAGWDLGVTLSKFDSGTQNNELRGAVIEFVSPRLQYNGNNPTNAPTIHAPGMRLEADGTQQMIMNAPDGRGAGTSSLIWGDQEALMDQWEAEGFDPETETVKNDAVRLLVPGATAKDAATYRATLTWALTSVADETGETTP